MDSGQGTVSSRGAIYRASIALILVSSFIISARALDKEEPSDADSLRKWINAEAARLRAPMIEPRDKAMDEFADGVAALQLNSFLVNKSFDLDKGKLDFYAENAGIYTPHIVPFLAVLPNTRDWLADLTVFLQKHWANNSNNRIGIGWANGKKNSVAAVLVASQPVILEPAPLRMLPSPYKVKIKGAMRGDYENPRLFVKAPESKPIPRPLFPDVNGKIETEINLDAPGVYQVEIMVDGARGPEIGALLNLYCMVEPPKNPVEKLLPHSEFAEMTTLDDVLFALNNLRQSEGLLPLRRQSALDKAAREQSEAMCQAGDTTHRAAGKSLQSRLDSAKIKYSAAGENVAFNKTLGAAYEAMLASPAHRKAMLDKRFTAVGIHSASDKEGGYYLTLIFTAPKKPQANTEDEEKRIRVALELARLQKGLDALEESPEMTETARKIMEILNDGKKSAIENPHSNERVIEIVSANEKIEGMDVLTLKRGGSAVFTSKALEASNVRSFGLAVKPLANETENLAVIIYATD
ncbi:MAG: hypothetical protein Kow0090_01080 [Myxococcota bacterium]